MKKIIAVLLAALLSILPVFAAAEEEVEEINLMGGWVACEDTAVTEEAAAALEAAASDLTTFHIEPAALLAMQTEADTNYCLLCYVSEYTPELKTYLSLAYVYSNVNTDGDFRLAMTDMTAADPEDADGWLSVQDCTVTDEMREKLAQAMQGMVGSTVEPIALIATLDNEEVDFSSYLLCKVAPVVPNAEWHYAMVIISEPVDGTPKLVAIEDMGLE